MCPSPLVTIFVSLPPSYVTTRVRPSNFHEIQIGWPSAHFTRSSTFFVLARDSAGNSCGSFCPVMSSSDTLAVGLSGRTSPVSSSSPFRRSNMASHS